MKKAFLDPKRPLPTCTSEKCDGCAARDGLTCHFGAKHLLRFFAIVFPPIIAAGIGIASMNPWLLAPWIGFFLFFFGFAEIRALCSHCPHYAETETRTLRCWANYGSPKIWKYRPGPMTVGDRAVFFGGAFFILAYPTVFIILGSRWIQLGVFAALVVLAAVAMSATMCSRCINLACPFNKVNGATKERFIELNRRSGLGTSQRSGE